MTRTGVFLDAGSEQNAVHSQLTTTLDGLLTLEASLPAFITQPRLENPYNQPHSVIVCIWGMLKGGFIMCRINCPDLSIWKYY